MASKKIPIGLNPVETEVVKRVESMMEPVKIRIVDSNKGVSKPALAPSKITPASETALPPIDIFSDPKTAPEVPSGLLDKLAVDDEPSPSPDSAPEPTPIAPPVTRLAGIADRVPQLIASTAPKSKPVIVAPTSNESDPALTTTNAAPVFKVETDDNAAPPLPEAEADVNVPPLKLDDPKTDAALAAITANDADALLAAQDAALGQSGAVRRSNDKVTKPAKASKRLWQRPWFLLLLFVAALAVVFAIPTTRYKIVGLVVKQNLQLRVVDVKTNRPVTKARISVDGQGATTDASGATSIRLPVGPHHVVITKQYYATDSVDTFLDFKSGQPLVISLVATGRQVPVTVTDKLTGKPIAGAEITVVGSSAKTDAMGKAVIVLPTKTKALDGKLTATGYNALSASVQITDASVPANSFALTAAGKIYFLSNEQGSIDVMKANLDGSGRETVVKGTGKEDPNTTVLLSSRDWHYSILKAQRSSSQAALYMLDSSNDKLVEFDSGDANFTPIGWYGHAFLYDSVRNTVATSQNAHELIKSYDAERGQLNQLDSSQAATVGSGYVFQGFYNFYILDNLLVYNTQWYSRQGADIGARTASIRGVSAGGQNKKDYQTIPSAGLGYIQSTLATPTDIYFSAFNYNDSKTTYYEFQDQAIKTSTNVNAASFNKLYPTYVLSPGGKQTVWTETRNGKPVVMLGDATAGNPQAVANLSGYSAYGWYSDNYLLVSKKNSELYIVASNGNGLPVKLTDYFKPAQSLVGNGFGYGGL